MSSSVLRVISFIFRNRSYVFCSVIIFSTAALDAQFDTAIVPHRYIVVYRNAAIPGDAKEAVAFALDA